MLQTNLCLLQGMSYGQDGLQLCTKMLDLLIFCLPAVPYAEHNAASQAEHDLSTMHPVTLTSEQMQHCMWGQHEE